MSGLRSAIRKIVIFIITLGVIALAVMTFINMGGSRLFKDRKLDVIIDTDSGNEIDDLYALTRALLAPELNVIGVTSAHWSFHPEAGDSSLAVSQKLNEKILKLMDREEIPHPAGADNRLMFWGTPVPNPSAAAEFIIKKAHETPKGKKLTIITLGAMTNIASAIVMDSSILPKIKVYSMSLHYEPKTRVWNKNEFNVRNDLDAADILLNTDGLDLHIMTATTSQAYRFSQDETFRQLKGKGGVWDFLAAKWEERFPDNKEWIMWDLALIHALINPDLAREESVLTPPENKPRQVYVYTRINTELMEADFWSAAKSAWKKEKAEN